MCLSSGTYGECLCEGSSEDDDDESSSDDDEVDEVDDSSLDAGTAGASDAGKGSGDAGNRSDGGGGNALDGGSAPANQLFSGTANLIELFGQGEEIWVVDGENAVHLSAKDGSTLHSFKAARPLQAAAFDGTYLVVTDGAKLTTLKASDLSKVIEGNLVEACASAVLLSSQRFVCGPANDWDRIFYTYDALSAQLLASSAKFTYHGTPMKRVPGYDAFVTVTTNLSPSDFYLYKLGTDNAAAFVNESPYHGDFAATTVMAFDSDMPEHLINSQGLLLKFSPTCSDTTQNSFTSQCFVKDGSLGTLTGAQQFSALDNDGPLLTALVNPRGNDILSSTSTADAGYLLQTVDVPSRAITSQRTVQLPQGSPTKLCALPDKGMVVVGVSKGNALYPPSTTTTSSGYSIVRFDVQK